MLLLELMSGRPVERAERNGSVDNMERSAQDLRVDTVDLLEVTSDEHAMRIGPRAASHG